jgi:hypothetical protein
VGKAITNLLGNQKEILFLFSCGRLKGMMLFFFLFSK